MRRRASFLLLSGLGDGGYAAAWVLAGRWISAADSRICRSIAIAGRPPVTNMYESVVWVAFGTIFFALVFEAIYRSRYFLLGAVPVAVVSLILADTQTLALDRSINPLVPVLRDNFWLTTHVLTITLSYAAFALALGNWPHRLAQGYQREQRLRPSLYNYLYRTLQVGVLLLATGTILGGVWANYSWGRFWDWDPKETWALITLLGYLIVLHGRIAGKWAGFGMAVGAVLAFQGVLMAWYGVNFVLGVGLHSYGFGTGGFVWALALRRRGDRVCPAGHGPEDPIGPSLPFARGFKASACLLTAHERVDDSLLIASHAIPPCAARETLGRS